MLEYMSSVCVIFAVKGQVEVRCLPLLSALDLHRIIQFLCQRRVGFVMSDLLTLTCRASSPDGL